MIDATSLPAAAVLTPIALAVCALLLPRRATLVGVVAAVVTAAVALTAVAAVARGGTLVQHLAGWAPPLGIAVRLDGPGAVFLALTAVVGLVTSLYAAAEPRTRGIDDRRFWPAWLLAWAGMNAVYVSGDLFNTYVALEVVGLCAVALVALGGRGAWGPALRYLLVAVLGSLLFLVAVAAVYGATGTLDIALAGQRFAATRTDGAGPDPAALPLLLATVGLSLKTALFPLHGWLPPAHASAPAAVSPVLSGLVVKAAYFVLLRLWFDVAGPDPALALALGLLGAGAVLWGGLCALRQDELKRIVAYSTVAQVGYLYLVFPLTAHAAPREAASSAWFGAIAVVVAHGLSKAALFMSAGTLLIALGSARLDDLAGAARTLPMVAMTMTLASVGLVGVPISLGFSGKWQLLLASVQTGQWGWVLVLLAGSLLAAGYLLRPLAAVLRGADDTEAGRAPAPVPRALSYLPLLLALASVVLGLAGAPIADLAAQAAHLGGGR